MIVGLDLPRGRDQSCKFHVPFMAPKLIFIEGWIIRPGKVKSLVFLRTEISAFFIPNRLTEPEALQTFSLLYELAFISFWNCDQFCRRERFSLQFCLVLRLLKAANKSSSWCQLQCFVLFFRDPEKCLVQTGPWPPTRFTWATDHLPDGKN